MRFLCVFLVCSLVAQVPRGGGAGGGGSENTSVVNTGTGAQIGKTATNVTLRSVIGTSGVACAQNTDDVTCTTDSATVPQYLTQAGAPSANCTAGRDFSLDTTNTRFYRCSATNVWTEVSRIKSGTGAPASGDCDAAAEVGTLYYRTQADATNATLYVCSRTAAAPTFAWELVQGGGGSGYATIQSYGTAQTARTTMNFLGALNARDNSGSTRTDVRWRPDRRTYWITEAFVSGSISNTTIGQLGWILGNITGTQAVTRAVAPTWSALGLVRMDTGATTGNGGFLCLNCNGTGTNTPHFVDLADHTDDARLGSSFDFTLVQTATTRLRIGLALACATTGTTDMLGIRYDTTLSDTNFMFVSRVSNADVTLSTGVAADTAKHNITITSDLEEGGSTVQKFWLQFDGGTKRSVCAAGCDLTSTQATTTDFDACTQLLTDANAVKSVYLHWFDFWVEP